MSTAHRSLGTLARANRSLWAALATASLMGLGLLAAAVVAYLVSGGFWYLALAPLLVVPTFVVLHRYPLAAISVWFALTPLVVETSNGLLRKVFWLVHRGLPVVTLLVIATSILVGIRTRKVAKLGWPELMMAGYIVATLFSIAFTSDQAGATAILFFDRVIIPMCLYLIVRLLEPDERDLKWMIPAILLVFLVQSLIGLLSWSAPGLVPSDWRGKIGARTTGTLRTPDVFGTTVLFCGLFLLHAGISHARRLSMRIGSVLLFALTMLMIFLTYSRANWLAGFVAVLGALYIYRRSLRLLVPIVVPIVAIALVSGLLDSQIQFARERIRSAESEESALSRLPVVVASVRMFEKKPVAGWGYEGFDSVSRQFQSRVGNLVSPVKPHASHNVYLTLLAEQGFVGLLLFLGPMFYWLFKTKARWRHIPATGLLSRRLISLLWLAIASHIVVNNFSRMQVPFGLGMWWLILGLIASIVARYSKAEGQPWTLA